MAVAPDARLRARRHEAGVTGCGRAAGGDAHHLTVAARQVLRIAALRINGPVAGGHPQVTRVSNTSREPKCPVLCTLGDCRKMTVTFDSVRVLVFSSARATVVPLGVALAASRSAYQR